jgi:hypothetical protein
VCRGASTAASDELRYLKSVALHQWLFGVELPGARTQRSRGAAGGAPKNPRARQRALHAHSRAALPLPPPRRVACARRHGAAFHAGRAARAAEP